MPLFCYKNDYLCKRQAASRKNAQTSMTPNIRFARSLHTILHTNWGMSDIQEIRLHQYYQKPPTTRWAEPNTKGVAYETTY